MTTFYNSEGKPTSHKGDNDLFTRLSVALCEEDNGVRPVNSSWPGADKGWLSPAISFETFPIVQQVHNTLFVSIKNFGTMDATGVTLETAYNLWMGNEREENKSISNIYVGMIPAGSEHVAEVPWTPPEADTEHACIHARVFDIYSLTNYPVRCSSWNSYTNPQAGNRNIRLVQIENENEAVVVPFKAKNIQRAPIKVNILVSEVNRLRRHQAFAARFPLPFRPDPVRASLATRTPERSVNTELRTMGRISRTATGLRLPSTNASMLWPSPAIDSRLVHDRFGFDLSDNLNIRSQGKLAVIRMQMNIPDGTLSTLMRATLRSQEEKEVNVVIPPSMFPTRGRRKIIQVDYQRGLERPVQHFIYLTR